MLQTEAVQVTHRAGQAKFFMLCCILWERPRAPPGRGADDFYMGLRRGMGEDLRVELRPLEQAVSRCGERRWKKTPYYWRKSETITSVAGPERSAPVVDPAARAQRGRSAMGAGV